MNGASNGVDCHVFGLAPYARGDEAAPAREKVRLQLSEASAPKGAGVGRCSVAEAGVETEVRGGRLHIRVPPMRSDSAFRAVLGALGELFRESEELRWTVDLSRADDLPIAFLTFLAALGDRLRSQGRTLQLRGVKQGTFPQRRRLDRLDLAHASDPEH